MVSKLSKEQIENLRKALLARESSNNYQAVNQLGYIGGYQMSAATLETLGYLKKGASKKGNAAVNDPANWTGKNGLNNVDDFFNNPEAQDKAFVDNLKFNNRVLNKLGTINEETAPEDVAGYLAASHLLGATGASKNLTAEDANKVSGTKYYDLGKAAVLAPVAKDETPPPVANTLYPEVTDRYAMDVLAKPNTKNKEAVKRVQKIIGAEADGIWGPKSQAMFDLYNKQVYDNTVNPISDTPYREEQMPTNIAAEPTGFENPFLSVKNWWNSL